MSDKIRWGILSTGAIAQTFARGLQASETGQLVAVGSRSAESANKFGEQFAIASAHRHTSYEALLADKDVQAVYIAPPHPYHAEWTIKAIEAGKHVLCEKPFALNQSEAMAMIEAAQRQGVFLMEAFMYRCHPQTAKLLELLRAKAIGEVRVIQATFSFQAGFNPNSRIFNNALAGGGIMDVGCYPVSMARLIAGTEPVQVTGTAHLGQTGVDEWAIASLKFPGGILAQLATGVALNQENVVRIFGSDGRITLPNPWVSNRQAAEPGKIIVQTKAGTQEIVVEAKWTSFTYEADAVGRAILAGKQEGPTPAMTWADTLGNIQTLDQWRAAVGLTYEAEKPANYTHTVTRRPLAVKQPVTMKYANVDGVEKPVSRLVMGCDNQRTIAHLSVMADDFFERGGNCFDTAYVYGGGTMEKLLGQWIKNRGIRKDVVVIAKGAHTPQCDPVSLTKQLHESLSRLQTDYADIYFMHRDNTDIPVGEFVDVLNEHHKAGRIRAFGGSNWTTERVAAANRYAKRKGLTGFAAVSNNFSLARMVQPVWDGCISADAVWHKRTQVPLFAWSSQARGFFTVGDPAYTTDKSLVECWYSDDNFQRQARVKELAAKRKVTPIQIALAYVLNQPFPTFALVGPRQLAETRTTWPGLALELSRKEMKWLNLEA
jgi:predicted dehydrogenase/aryl-alcohol dehydrogenase-like predicted oxidoreductase